MGRKRKGWGRKRLILNSLLEGWIGFNLKVRLLSLLKFFWGYYWPNLFFITFMGPNFITLTKE